MGWFLLFAATVLGAWFWREHRVRQREMQSASAPHRAGQRYIGQVLTLTESISEGAGRAKLGNRQWTLRGPNVPAGTRVRVTGVDGVVLIVDRLPA
jgi:membrane protein implicated in regulation of membrane protease activity